MYAGVYLAYAVHAEVVVEPAVVLARARSTCERTDGERERERERERARERGAYSPTHTHTKIWGPFDRPQKTYEKSTYTPTHTCNKMISGHKGNISYMLS